MIKKTLLAITAILIFNACQKYENTYQVPAEASFYSYSIDNSIDISQNTSKSKLDRTQSKYINKEKCDQIIDKKYFTICYSYNFKAAKSVTYTLDGDLVNQGNIEDRPDFYPEEALPYEYRARKIDYYHSGYDRGHLAPDAAFDWSEDSLEATYSLANIIPQDSNVNQHQWVRAEEHARKEAVALGEIKVINLVVYPDNPKRIGEDKIAVSKGFYKIMYNIAKNYKECFYYENNASMNKNNLTGNQVSCKELVNF